MDPEDGRGVRLVRGVGGVRPVAGHFAAGGGGGN